MATYRMVYGEPGHEVTETLEDVSEVVREDGWVVLFRGSEAILRAREEHVEKLEEITP